jgi:hypothetical protein
MTVNDDISLLEEYNQWAAVRKLPMQDTSPEEFMRDRLKEVAMDRINNALAYLESSAAIVEDVKDILEGKLEYIPEVSGGNIREKPEDEDEDTTGAA